MKASASLIAILLISLTGRAADGDGPIVPVYEEPRHRMLWEDFSFYILDLHIPPGDTTLFHTHRSPIFYITLHDSALKTQVLGEEWQVLPVRNLDAGTARFNETYLEQPVTHRVSNIGDETVRSILILNQRNRVNNPDPELHASLPGIPEMDSTWFSQSRLILEGHEILDWDGVDEHIVFVLVSDSHVTLRYPGSKTAFGLTSLWSLVYLDGEHGYRFENHSAEPATIIAVALR